MNDLVSIIMPSYNTEKYITYSINSVLSQTYTNFELLIIDDCSTDATIDVINNYSDPRIRLLHNPYNSGAAVSRNFGLREAKGKWIAFLDSDDIWSSDKLEKQISFMEKNDYHFSYTNYEEITSEGTLTGIKVTGPKRITRFDMYNYCWPGCLTVMYDASIVGLIQIADVKKNNDYAMWLKAVCFSDCYLLDEVLAQYRRGRNESISTSDYKTLIKWHYVLFRKAENQGIIKSCLNTFRNILFGIYKKVFYVKRG